jgi:hypothetical protein
MPKAERDLNTLPPHLFGFVKDCFVTMQQDGVPQSIVISGESGSGKTATMKIALQYLIDTSKAMRASQSGAGGKVKTAMSGGRVAAPSSSPLLPVLLLLSLSLSLCLLRQLLFRATFEQQ